MTAAEPVAIVGGGPAGMALALALHRQGMPARIFEARRRGDVRQDARILALSHGSRLILETLGVWAQIEATPILHIHISQRGGFGRTRLSAAEQGLPALGYVVPAASLSNALDAALLAAGVPYLERTQVERVDCSDAGARAHTGAGEVGAHLVVYAEGAAGLDAEACSRDYGQSAVVCHVELALPHGNCAWERFTPDGPLALLPLGAGMSVVYTCPSVDAELLGLLDDADFIIRLQAQFGSRLRFVGATPRHVYPLALRYRRSPVAVRSVWIGNAAQTLHPVAGQGFNLALRDIAQLSTILAGRPDPGAAAVLQAYAAARRLDRLAGIRCTDALARLFVLDWPLAQTARGAGLAALDLLPPLRGFLARRMIFGARAW